MKLTKLKYYAGLLFIPIVALSCKKVIKLDLGDDSGKLVIEGNITDRLGTQYVKLSRNVPFTSTNTYPPVTGATVTIDNNQGRMAQFKEGPAGTYVLDSAYATAGRTYTLSVITGGKVYKANSTMPD